MNSTPDDKSNALWAIVEHRRQPLGGTKHIEYGVYDTREDALDALRDLPHEFGVDFSVERRRRS